MIRNIVFLILMLLTCAVQAKRFGPHRAFHRASKFAPALVNAKGVAYPISSVTGG